MVRRALCALGLVLFPLDVFGQGTLLWEVQEDLGGNDAANVLLLSGKVAIVGGYSQTGDPEIEQILQGFSRTKGTLQWDFAPQFTSTFPTSTFPATRTSRIASSKKSLFVDDDLGLTAFDSQSGTFLWRVPGACCDIVASPTSVVTFAAVPNTATGTELLTTAYDAGTGAMRWERHEGTNGFDYGYRSGVISQNRLVRILGAASLAYPFTTQLLIRSYDLGSGAPEWEASLPADLLNAKVLLAGGRVVVAGTVGPSLAESTTYLAAFSARTGAPLWNNTAPESGSFADIAVNGSRLAGVINQFPAAFAVQTYDVTNGTLLWQDTQVLFAFSQTALAVALNDRAVYVGGQFVQDFTFDELMVRAYDAAAGTLL
jgi:outer membrane protein assembly factor BamB